MNISSEPENTLTIHISRFSGSIKAKGQAIETAGINSATDVMNQAAQEMNLLKGSADMQTIDESIEQLSKDADVNITNNNITMHGVDEQAILTYGNDGNIINNTIKVIDYQVGFPACLW